MTVTLATCDSMTADELAERLRARGFRDAPASLMAELVRSGIVERVGADGWRLSAAGEARFGEALRRMEVAR